MKQLQGSHKSGKTEISQELPSGWEGTGQSGREQGARFGGGGGHLGQLKGINSSDRLGR